MMDDEASIKAIVNPAAFKRGKELIDSNKLHEVAFEGDECEKASALCEGSNPGDSYDISVSIDPSDATKQPTYRCSCPAGRGMCKHVIALLLHRVAHLASLRNGASSSERKVEDVEDPEPSLGTIDWVRNPVKLIPDPAARRALPSWMTADAIEKPKKGRKQQKVEAETDDGPQSSGRKPPARKRNSPRGKKKVDEAEDEAMDDEEPVTPAKKATRQTRNRKGDGDQRQDKQAAKAVEEPGGAKPRRGRSRKAKNDDDNISSPEDMKNASDISDPSPEVERDHTPKKGKRRLKKMLDDDDETAADPTLDELMSIAHQNLDQQDSPTTMNVDDNSNSTPASNVNETATQPAKKKAKLDDSIFPVTGWRSKSASSAAENGSGKSTNLPVGTNTVGSDKNNSDHPDEVVAPLSSAARIASTDTLEDEMLGMLFGGYVSKKASARGAPEKDREVQQGRPETAKVSKDAIEAPERAAKVIEETGATKSIQPKPKKKSSLKDQIGLLLQ